MKIKKFSIIIAGLMILTLLASCGKSNSNSGMIPLSYDNQIREGGIKDDGKFNKEMFYRNDTVLGCADPQVIYISDKDSEEYGYYYVYGTTAPDTGFETYRSKDLQNWEPLSSIKGFMAYTPPADHEIQKAFWAPEVIYDEESKQYYLYFSGLKSDSEIWGKQYPGLAVSDQPYGPFVPCDESGLDPTKPIFDDAKANAVVDEGAQGEWIIIDQSPFVGADGNKYLLFNRLNDPSDGNKNSVWGVKMNSWSDIDYSTLKKLMSVGYKTTARTEKMSYESTTGYDEGPFMYVRKKEDGTAKYYLTASINGLNDYSVIQAISDSPLGDFVKPEENEGGILLANDNMMWDHIKGTGHHSFIQAGDELLIVYHQQYDRQKGDGYNRYLAIDRISFAKNQNGDEVMVANGPTWSLQPQLSFVSDYKNIAPEGKVNASKGNNVEALTDGLLSLYKPVDFVKEFETDKTTTITLDFEDYREVKALMVYNSKLFDKAFVNIDRVEFDFKNDQLPEGGTAYIENLEFDWLSYKNANAEDMRPGGSAVAVFAPMQVKTIRITLNLPKERPENLELTDDEGYVIDQTIAAIAEIAVLGK